MKLILLRHGESEWNFLNKFTGWTDVGLTENGIKVNNEEDLEVSRARLKLIEAAKVVLNRALRIMGMNSPEVM